MRKQGSDGTAAKHRRTAGAPVDARGSTGSGGADECPPGPHSVARAALPDRPSQPQVRMPTIDTRARIVMRCVPSPLGTVRLGVCEPMREGETAALCLLEFDDNHRWQREAVDLRRHLGREAEDEGEFEVGTGASDLLDRVQEQLAEYFAGARRAFDLPLAMPGTLFQRSVWSELLRISFGATTSYGEIARRIGSTDAQRAVGAANGANRIAIVVPCHRVIDAQGRLHGYGGGLERKRWLLDHEAGALFSEATQRPGAGARDQG